MHKQLNTEYIPQEMVWGILFGVAQRKRGGPITLRSLDRNQAPKVTSIMMNFVGSKPDCRDGCVHDVTGQFSK